ncbi:hypothetical protein ACIQB5_42130 [Streptomyces sp. NPDC088560]|uniref:hypothetical protein n=1 Tax=Streptomyces sp. NPDC088560 TaxID=3365868 RepID=UPI00380AD82E
MNSPRQAPLLWDRALPDPPPSTPTIDDLPLTARDAAQRATAVLAGEPPITDPLIDLIRLLDRDTNTTRASEAAERAGISSTDLRRLRAAHTFGGPPGAHATLYRTTPDASSIQPALEAINRTRSHTARPLQVDGNRITDDQAQLQIRLGPDDRWYPYTAHHEQWVPVPGPSTEAAAAYTAAVNAKRNRHG